MSKNLNNTHLKMVWQNAMIDLREANRIVFLGYSFPLADFEFRYLLLKSAFGTKKLTGKNLGSAHTGVALPRNPPG
jgi:hypothetical protein